MFAACVVSVDVSTTCKWIFSLCFLANSAKHFLLFLIIVEPRKFFLPFLVKSSFCYFFLWPFIPWRCHFQTFQHVVVACTCIHYCEGYTISCGGPLTWIAQIHDVGHFKTFNYNPAKYLSFATCNLQKCWFLVKTVKILISG